MRIISQIAPMRIIFQIAPMRTIFQIAPMRIFQIAPCESFYTCSNANLSTIAQMQIFRSFYNCSNANVPKCNFPFQTRVLWLLRSSYLYCLVTYGSIVHRHLLQSLYDRNLTVYPYSIGQVFFRQTRLGRQQMISILEDPIHNVYVLSREYRINGYAHAARDPHLAPCHYRSQSHPEPTRRKSHAKGTQAKP